MVYSPVFLPSYSHHFADNIRTKFISASGVEKLTEKLGDSNVNVQLTALVCVTALCVHGITFSKIPPSDSHHFPDNIRTTFISANGVQKIVEELDYRLWETQAALGGQSSL